jgi:hypothetical protein
VANLLLIVTDNDRAEDPEQQAGIDDAVQAFLTA